MAEVICSVCGMDQYRVAVCREADCPREERARDALNNARLLARDATIHGTTFTDITGRRIDPATVLPSSSGTTSEQGGAQSGS